jgi:hypothetical protein
MFVSLTHLAQKSTSRQLEGCADQAPTYLFALSNIFKPDLQICATSCVGANTLFRSIPPSISWQQRNAAPNLQTPRRFSAAFKNFGTNGYDVEGIHSQIAPSISGASFASRLLQQS